MDFWSLQFWQKLSQTQGKAMLILQNKGHIFTDSILQSFLYFGETDNFKSYLFWKFLGLINQLWVDLAFRTPLDLSKSASSLTHSSPHLFISENFYWNACWILVFLEKYLLLVYIDNYEVTRQQLMFMTNFIFEK